MKYLIVDDHALVRSALSMMLLDRDPSAEVLTAEGSRSRSIMERALLTSA